jgi:hypothetical protein
LGNLETRFKLEGELDSEIISKIVKNHLASNGYYPDADSLQQGNGHKDIVDIIDDKVMSLMDLLERKKLCNSQRMERSNARKNNKE